MVWLKVSLAIGGIVIIALLIFAAGIRFILMSKDDHKEFEQPEIDRSQEYFETNQF